MASFWALFLLFAWGCLRPDGLVHNLRIWLSDDTPWIDPFPLLGKLDLSMAIALGLVVIIAVVLMRVLDRPKIADMLIETESELRKVTWPAAGETWKGALDVVATVAFMLLFLTSADMVITYVLSRAMGGGG